jgi:SulP family sulfate permease
MIFKRNFASHFEIATAIRESLKNGYSLKTFGNDAWAGLVVALLSLPLSIALSVAVGLSPENGVYTSIIAGFIVPLLGGSRYQVTGPTAAFVVIVAPIVADLGMRGIIWCQMIAGILLVIMGISKLGKYIRFVPYPVTTGFTTGIAVIMAIYAMDNFLGLKIDHKTNDVISRLENIFNNIGSVNIYEVVVGFVCLFTIIALKKVKYVPSAITGIIVAGVLAFILKKSGHDVATISSTFTYVENQTIFRGISLSLPSFHVPNFIEGDILEIPSLDELKIFLAPAFVIAALAALEASLCATVSDTITGTKHNSNAELNALGIGNILSGMVMGLPATGAFSRTSQNINSRAKTPIASALHAVFILLFLIALVPLINQIPMAALSALLLVTASRISYIKPFFKMFLEAPKSDIIVLLTCFILTVFVDIIAGLTVGIVLASLLFMKTVAEVTDVQLESKGANLLPEHKNLPEGVLVYNIDGPLFFGSAQKAYNRSESLNDKIKTVIINMEHVPYIDMSGLMAIRSVVGSILKEKKQTILVGNNKVLSLILSRSNFSDNPNVLSVSNFDEAISKL